MWHAEMITLSFGEFFDPLPLDGHKLFHHDKWRSLQKVFLIMTMPIQGYNVELSGRGLWVIISYDLSFVSHKFWVICAILLFVFYDTLFFWEF